MKSKWFSFCSFVTLISILFAVSPATAEEFWSTLNTEHFEIIFPLALSELAQETAIIAEEAHVFWTEEFGYDLPGTTYIELRDSGDITRISSSVLPHNKINIDHPFGDAFILERKADESLLKYLIFREYGRIVNLARVEGFNIDLQFIFGKVILPEELRPFLEREGYVALSLLDRPYQRMIMNGMLAANELPTSLALSAPFRSETMPDSDEQAQVIGAGFLKFLKESEGPGILREIHRISAEYPLSSATIGSLQLVLGQSLVELYAGFLAEQRVRISEELQDYQAVAGLERLSSTGVQAMNPSWSPDAFALIYSSSDPQRVPGLRWVQRDGLGDEGLIHCNCRSVRWIDSNKLIYAQVLDQPGGESVYDLFTYDLLLNLELRLTRGERIIAVEPFPMTPGKVLLLRNSGLGGSSLVSFNRATGSRQILAEFNADVQISSMTISPDERFLALSVWDRARGDVLYLLNLDQETIEIVDIRSAKELSPAFSQDGKYLLFSASIGDSIDIYAVDVGQNELHKISNSLAGSLSPRPSPDGASVAFVEYGSDGYSLVKIPYAPAFWERSEIETTSNSIPLASIITSQSESDSSLTTNAEFQAYEIELFDLIPNSWLPILGPWNLGTYIFHSDPLRLFDFELSTGLNFAPFQIFYNLSYNRFQTHSTLKLQMQGTPAFQKQVLSIEIPFFRSPSASRSIEFGVNRTTDQTEFFLLGTLIDENGLDLFSRRSELDIRGAVGSTIEGFVRRFEFNWLERLRMPIFNTAGSQWLNVTTSAGWSDLSDYRLGGLKGDHPLRGHQQVIRGSQRISSNISYEFPITKLRSACCILHPLPLYADTLRGNLFGDFGIIGNSLSLQALRIGIGLEFQASVILGYGLVDGLLRFGIGHGIGKEDSQFYFLVEQEF
jgi:Tol biopolymer transport system component